MFNTIASAPHIFKIKIIWQLFRYAIIGFVSNGLLFVIYLALTWAGMNYMTAMSLLYITGTLITFHANRKWTFKNNETPLPQLIKYLLTYTFGYLINILILWLGVNHFKLQHQATQAIAIILVACFIFLALKFWAFPHKSLKSLSNL